MFCKAQHRRGEVDPHDFVTVYGEGHRHPTGAAPDVKDRSTRLPGQSAVEVDVAVGVPDEEAGRRQVDQPAVVGAIIGQIGHVVPVDLPAVEDIQPDRRLGAHLAASA